MKKIFVLLCIVGSLFFPKITNAKELNMIELKDKLISNLKELMGDELDESLITYDDSTGILKIGISDDGLSTILNYQYKDGIISYSRESSKDWEEEYAKLAAGNLTSAALIYTIGEMQGTISKETIKEKYLDFENKTVEAIGFAFRIVLDLPYFLDDATLATNGIEATSFVLSANPNIKDDPSTIVIDVDIEARGIETLKLDMNNIQINDLLEKNQIGGGEITKCTAIGNNYFGKEGTKVTKEVYEKECKKQENVTPTPITKCSEKDGKYYDKNGNSVSKEQYLNSCGLVENPQTGNVLKLTSLIILIFLAVSLLIISKKKKLYHL